MNILFVVEDIDIEHLGIMWLASGLQRAGHHVEVTDTSWRHIRRALSHKPFGLVAFSVPTLYASKYQHINRRIKGAFSPYSVFGGPHPTFEPELLDDPAIDCICRGEGEYAVLELAQCLAAGRHPDGIRNLWIKKNGEIQKNPVRPLIEHLDALPFPDRDIFPRGETFTKGKMHVLTSRGCPYQCRYCGHAAYANIYGKAAHRVRRRSVTNVLAEIQGVRQRGDVRLVMFEDDLFSCDQAWLNEFCERYAATVAIPFFCYVRADTVSEETVARLKSAGCVSVSLGVETLNQRARETVLGRHLSPERILRAARMITSRGLRLETTNIIGIPGTSLADDFDTMAFNRKVRADYASVKILMPYPGTPLRRWAQREGILNPGNLSAEEYPFRQNRNYRREVTNLRFLFGVGAACAWLTPAIKHIIRRRVPRLLLRLVFLGWEGYTAYFRLYPTGGKGWWGGVRKYMRICRR